MSLNETPGANRIHIGFYGKRNSGKSSLINAFTGQQVAIVSDVAGTTTDPIYKPMEVHGIGPCAVSYTHLDVYKRQTIVCIIRRMQIIHPVHRQAQPRPCLLYTSRCV